MLGVAAAGVAKAELVGEQGGEDVGFVEHELLTENVGKPRDVVGAENGTGDGAGAVGKRSNRLLDFVVVAVAGEGAVVFTASTVNAEVDLVLVVVVVGGAGVVVGRAC